MMQKRRVFFSFHFENDFWRASQIRQIGAVEGNQLANDNDWESIKSSGEKEIKKWIDNQLIGTSCTVVLIGSKTSGRKWIDYEIEKSWNDGKGLLGIYIHNLLDRNRRPSSKGPNPFDNFKFSEIVQTYDPATTNGDSKSVYNAIRNSLSSWIEEAIKIRNAYK